MINAPQSVLCAIDALERAGHEAYVVGGAVRDCLLGRVPGDWDLTTSALPDEIERVFFTCKQVLTGKQYGTVSVNIESNWLEITTYRVDGDYSDARHPDGVQFTGDLRGDLARRDFTVNAMAWNPSAGLVDPFEGARDIQERQMRCVGDAAERFGEDALRMLRAVRFASELGFTVESKTAAGIAQKMAGLRQIARERVEKELRRSLLGQRVLAAWRPFLPLLRLSVPELGYIEDSALLQSLKLADQLPCDYPLRLAVLLWHAYEKGEDITAALQALRLPRQTQEITMLLLANAHLPLPESRVEARFAVRQFGMQNAGRLARFAAAVATGQECVCQQPESVLAWYDAIERDGDCCTRAQLAVGGADLLAYGAAGKGVGILLELLLTAVIEERVPNKRETLLPFAAEYIRLSPEKYR